METDKTPSAEPAAAEAAPAKPKKSVAGTVAVRALISVACLVPLFVVAAAASVSFLGGSGGSIWWGLFCIAALGAGIWVLGPLLD